MGVYCVVLTSSRSKYVRVFVNGFMKFPTLT